MSSECANQVTWFVLMQFFLVSVSDVIYISSLSAAVVSLIQETCSSEVPECFFERGPPLILWEIGKLHWCVSPE